MSTPEEVYEANRERLLREHGEGKTAVVIDDDVRVVDSYADAFRMAVGRNAVDRFFTTELRREPMPVLLPACLAFTPV